MTVKTKRNIAIGGGTVLCAALAVLIAVRFIPEPETAVPSVPKQSSSSQVTVEMSATKHEETNPQDNSSVSSQLENDEPKTDEPEKDNAYDNSITEVVQNFPEPEKTESAAQNEKTEPPKIEDEEMLTNPDKEPAYEPEQTNPQQTTSSDSAASSSTPKHGDKKDGKIYINGFGWVDDEGGGGEGEYLDGMYENGNKIGYFG